MCVSSDSAEPSDPEPTVHEETLADLESVFGRPRLHGLLDDLRSEIAKRLGTPSAEPRILADDAHVLTSVSGTLGFPALSRACAALERACLAGDEPAEPLRVAMAEAETASSVIAALHRKPE